MNHELIIMLWSLMVDDGRTELSDEPGVIELGGRGGGGGKAHCHGLHFASFILTKDLLLELRTTKD